MDRIESRMVASSGLASTAQLPDAVDEALESLQSLLGCEVEHPFDEARVGARLARSDCRIDLRLRVDLSGVAGDVCSLGLAGTSTPCG